MQWLLACLIMAVATMFPNLANAEVIQFTCSWDNQRPVEFMVDLASKQATRWGQHLSGHQVV